MRKTSLAARFALMLLLAAGAMRVVSAQAQRPQIIAPALRPTTASKQLGDVGFSGGGRFYARVKLPLHEHPGFHQNKLNDCERKIGR